MLCDDSKSPYLHHRGHPKTSEKHDVIQRCRFVRVLAFFLCFNLSIVVTSGRQTLPGLLCSMKQSEVFIILFFCYFSFLSCSGIIQILEKFVSVSLHIVEFCVVTAFLCLFFYRSLVTSFHWTAIIYIVLVLFSSPNSYNVECEGAFFVTEQILFVALCASFDPVVCFT